MLKRLMRAVLMSVAICASSLTLTAPAGAKDTAGQSCPRVQVIGARGSGEGSLGKGGMGATVHSATRPLDEISGVRVSGLAYPAVPVGWDSLGQLLNLIGAKVRVRNLGAYNDSMREGREQVMRMIAANTRGCAGKSPKTRFVFVGYSQGAQVLADMYERYLSDTFVSERIIGMALFGDPKFNPASTYGFGTFEGVRSGILGKRSPKLLNPGRIVSYCLRGDVICQGGQVDVAVSGILYGWPSLSLEAHKRYHGSGVALSVGRRMAWLVRRYLKLPNAPSAPSPVPARAPTPSAPPAPSAPRAPAPQTWTEQQGSLGANTFQNPQNASGMGPKIPAWAYVQVSCKFYAPAIPSANPDGYWYRIASAPWSNSYYAVANTFWNGDTPGQTPYTHFTDWAVPDCPGSPVPAPVPTPPPPPPPPPAASSMCCDQRLNAASSDYLQSPNGRYRFVMQQDGNLVLYAPSGPIWTTSTVGRGANHLRMQGDGNLVIYNGLNVPIWSSGTPRHYSSRLHVQDDGNVVIYDAGTPTWSTGTAGRN